VRQQDIPTIKNVKRHLDFKKERKKIIITFHGNGHLALKHLSHVFLTQKHANIKS